jgi:hypothetical protein
MVQEKIEWLITGFLKRLTLCVQLVEQELITLSGHPFSTTLKNRGPGGSVSYVVGSNNSYKRITNTAWVRAQICKLQKGCTRLAAASDKVYQLLAHAPWSVVLYGYSGFLHH